MAPAKAPVRDLYAGMNKTEERRGQELEALKRTGHIAAWWYEAWTFLLAHDCRYTPDFVIQAPDGSLRVEETKGFMRDDALVKLKLFARLYPFPLRVLVWKSGTWQVTDVHP